jgi:hypothetical protein
MPNVFVQKQVQMKALIFILMFCCFQILSASAGNDRIWLEATINGKSARLILDTGSPVFYTLYRQSAKRLGIAVTNFTSNSTGTSTNEMWTGYTGQYELQINGFTSKAWFWIVDSPMASRDLTGDGFIGWPALRNCLANINARSGIVEGLQNVPVDTNGWVKLPIETGADYLRLVLKKPDGSRAVLAVDSGADLGVKLSSKLWQEWKSTHTNSPMTLIENFNFSEGFTVSEVGWAKEISFDPLTLTEVPVMQASSVDLALGGKDFEATLGFAALKRLYLVVDGAHGVAYLHPKTEKPPPDRQNRTGAVFIPSNSKSGEWVARVITNGPAYNAGMRDGDILLKVNGTKIKTFDDLMRTAEQAWKLPSGTSIKCTVKRDKKVFELKVVLKDILGQ